MKSILRVRNGLDLNGVTEREVLRDFLKRVLRLVLFMVFDAIDVDALDAELCAIAHETVFATLVRAGWDGYKASQRASKAISAVYL
ncbi:hypothetical protein [Nocardia sp. NPDC004722]